MSAAKSELGSKTGKPHTKFYDFSYTPFELPDELKMLILDLAFYSLCKQCFCFCGKTRHYYTDLCLEHEQMARCIKEDCNELGILIETNGERIVGSKQNTWSRREYRITKTLYANIVRSVCEKHLCIYGEKRYVFRSVYLTEINRHCNRLSFLGGGYCRKHDEEFGASGLL